MHGCGHSVALRGSGHQFFCVPVHHDHMPALCAEDIGGGETNAPRGAGNECSFHVHLLLTDCAAGAQQRQAVKMFQVPSEAVM